MKMDWLDMSGKDEFRALFPTVVMFFLSMLGVMSLFEFTKQAFNPDISIWGSHIITILFTSVVATIILYFPLRWLYREHEKTALALKHQQDAEEKLRKSEVQYRSFVESIEDSIYTVDRDCRYLLINTTHLMRRGLSRQDYHGKHYRDFHSPAESRHFETLVKKVFETRYPVRDEYEQGGKYYIRKLNPVIDPVTSEIIAVTVISYDITERKHIEDALAQANKKLNLLSGITRHDIRNQLMALMAYLEISKESFSNPEEFASCIAKEEKIAETINQQIRFTKDYEDLGVKAPLWQRISTLVKKVTDQVPVGTVTVDPGDPQLEIFADPLLEKVFFNLIENALRYGGEKLTSVRITSRQEQDFLVITVEDDGQGISAHEKDVIFERGYGKNTGFGLFLIREILSMTGISIRENGTEGTGARFEIQVPEGKYRFCPA